MTAKKIEVLEIPYHATFYTPGEREIDLYHRDGVYKRNEFDFSFQKIRYDHETYQNQNIKELMEQGHENETETIEANIQLGKVISDSTKKAIENNKYILAVGGNCGHAVGIAGGIQRALPGKKVGLVWLDAHGDMNRPETSELGMIGGMPVAVCGGVCLEEWRKAVGLVTPIEQKNLIISDARNLDQDEVELLQVSEFVHLDTDAFNSFDTWKCAIDKMSGSVEYIYFHIDADILDGKFVPNHNTIEYEGVDLMTLRRNSKYVMETGKVIAVALVSVYFPNELPGLETAVDSAEKILDTCLTWWK
ncbi:arginase family protein [bacterium 210820-DFI.6.37]|nr:arginase family protein [bacterium 210820-DFI.6.37]